MQNVCEGLGSAVYAPYVQTHPYFNDEVEWRQYDPDKARELLAEAGWDESRVLKFCVPSADTNRQRTAVIIQQFLADVGIQTEITTLDNATLFSSI